VADCLEIAQPALQESIKLPSTAAMGELVASACLAELSVAVELC
jgi:hypothetical protein